MEVRVVTYTCPLGMDLLDGDFTQATVTMTLHHVSANGETAMKFGDPFTTVRIVSPDGLWHGVVTAAARNRDETYTVTAVRDVA